MSELKPCHLCDSADLYQGWTDGNMISCTDCGLVYKPNKIGSQWHPSKELVAFAWNNEGKHPDTARGLSAARKLANDLDCCTVEELHMFRLENKDLIDKLCDLLTKSEDNQC